MSDQNWRRKVKREHVVTFVPLGAKDQSSLVGEVAAGLSALGYEVSDESHRISIGWQHDPHSRLEITYGDADRIGLDRWEAAVVYALAHADAFGLVEARPRTTVLPAVLAPR
jgi:hypothetical protein